MISQQRQKQNEDPGHASADVSGLASSSKLRQMKISVLHGLVLVLLGLGNFKKAKGFNEQQLKLSELRANLTMLTDRAKDINAKIREIYFKTK